MRILGIDPGLRRMGLAVINIDDDTHELGLVYFGYISHERVEQEYNRHLNNALHSLTDTLPKLFHEFAPNKIAAEIVPVGRLKTNTELVVAAITVCKVIGFQWGIPWLDYGANTVKKMVTGNGLASKAEVKGAVITLFPELQKAHQEEQLKQKDEGLKRATGLPWDVYDACAVAVTASRK